MRLQLMTWPEVERYLARTPAILVPIGSTEQHGPSGLIGTDALTAEGLALGAATVAGAVVAPTLAIGMAQHHLGFPGSASLRPSTLVAVVRDLVVSMAATGFRQFLFVNGHGGNIAPLRTAFAEIYADTSFAGRAGALRCELFNWFESRALGPIVRELYGAAEGSHATPSEVALAAYYHRGQLRDVVLEPATAPGGHDFQDAADYRRRYPDGRMGSNPALAREEHGARIHDAVVADLLEAYHALIAA
ncbi:MAG: creatininase family protein [Proteobacteria bacterium]|nr:creatininase family protein [Pseudomonadota bacterium]